MERALNKILEMISDVSWGVIDDDTAGKLLRGYLFALNENKEITTGERLMLISFYDRLVADKEFIAKQEVKKMVRIVFEYMDRYTNGEWRKQRCIVESVEECKEIYGLGIDCDYRIISVEEVQNMEYINDEAKRIIEQKLKQGKRIEMEYNHQTDELKILEHKITRIKLENK